MNRLLTVGSSLTLLVLLLSALLSTHTLGGWRLAVVLSGSMEPTIPTGSLVLTHAEQSNQYQVGDIVSFIAPTHGYPRVTHRIIQLYRSLNGRQLVRTKGDANKGEDTWLLSREGILGKSVLVVPRLGYLLWTLHTPIGFASCVLLSFCALVIPVLVRIYHS